METARPLGVAMRDRVIFLVTFGSALGCGVVGGVFFAFSTFVMTALARIAPSQGIAAMQSINVAVFNVAFMGALFGTAVTCALLVVASLIARQRPESLYVLVGALLYLVTVVGVTGVVHVPKNDALAVVDPASADGARLWADYVVTWTAWNHVRTIGGLAAAAALIMALLQSARAGAGA
jgi:uncharacterized membrane protein